MNISMQKLLLKMETELKGAKAAGSESALRERIHSLKTLCELVLDEPGNVQRVAAQASVAPIQSQIISSPAAYQPQAAMQSRYQAPTPTQSKKLEMDDEANGDSLLDF